MKNRMLVALSAAAAAVLSAFPSFATGYTWSSSVAEGSWSDPASWGGSGCPTSTDDTASMPKGTFDVNADADVTIKSMTFASGSKVKISGGHTVKTAVTANTTVLSGGASVEVSGAGTYLNFEGNNDKHQWITGSGIVMKTSDGGKFRIGTAHYGNSAWNGNNAPTSMQTISTGVGSEIIIGYENSSKYVYGASHYFEASDGGTITFGSSHRSSYNSGAEFAGTDAQIKIDSGTIQCTGTSANFIMGAASGQSVLLCGDNPRLTAGNNITLGGAESVALTFKPTQNWSESTARIAATKALTIGSASIVIDGSDYEPGAGEKLHALLTGSTLSLPEESNIKIENFPASLEVSLVLSETGKTLYLKAVSSVREVVPPQIAAVDYTGELQKPNVVGTADYTVVENNGGTNAGTYPVVLQLTNPGATAWPNGSTENLTLDFVINKLKNSWTVEPSLSKTSWGEDEEPATVSPGEALSGTAVLVSYDKGAEEMPLSRGSHTARFSVAESENYLALSAYAIDYTVLKKANGWVTAPVVEPTRYTPDALPSFTPPTAKFGDEVVCYFDGDPANTEVPTSMGKHTVTYAVAEGDDYQAFEQTIELTVLDRATLGVAQVMITGYDGGETLANFPALVRFSADNIKGLSASLLSEDGSDVRVYGEDGNELPFEIESWYREGESIIWVKIPELAPTSEKLTSVFVKWGATEARTTEPTDVWTEYLAVWHMNDTTIVDATGNGTELTGTSLKLIDGKVGKSLAASAGLAMSENFAVGYPNYAVSCWYRYGSSTTQVSPLSKGTYQGNGWYLEYKGTTTTMNYIINTSKSGVTTPDMLDNWNHVSVNLSGGMLTGYMNGTIKNAHSKKVDVDTDFNLSVLGSKGNGCVDELRIRKSAESAAWAKADYLAQTGDLVTYALVQNPEVEDVVVAPSETAPFVDNERNMTIGYRVASTGGSTVTVSALYAMEGAGTTNETVIGSSPVAQTEDAFGTIEDLKPGVNYWVAVYGVNASGAASEPTAWQQVAVPGPVAIEDVEFSQTKEEATITGVITGLGTKTAKLRYAFGKDEFAEIDLVLGEDGAFTVTLDRVSVTDVLTYQVVASNTLSTTTWGDFAWSAETEVKDSKDSAPVTYTWTGAASDEWADPENWEASVASAFGYPNSSEYATAKFTQAATVDLAGGTFGLRAYKSGNDVVSGLVVNSGVGEVTLKDGALVFPSELDVPFGAKDTTLVFDEVTLKGFRGLKFAKNAKIVFSGTTAQDWKYEPWDDTASQLVVRDGVLSSGYYQVWVKSTHEVRIENAVWNITKASTAVGSAVYFADGKDRAAQFVVNGAKSDEGAVALNTTWNLAIPETGRSQPVIVAKTLATGGGTFQIDVTDWNRGRLIPLVRFTGADQTGAITANLPKVRALENGVDVTAERNARLEWKNNTLYYKQNGKFGFAVIVR